MTLINIPLGAATSTTTTSNAATTTTTTFAPPTTGYSIVPDSGFWGVNWPDSGAIPKAFSSAGWTVNNLGFKQQTFLGASIVKFSINAGFGDSSSTLSAELINDEYNKSDETPLGAGDDIYHSGINGDRFIPPQVGSPVFFKFGYNFATIEQAYRKTFDDLYEMTTLTDGSNGPYISNPSTEGGPIFFLEKFVQSYVSHPQMLVDLANGNSVTKQQIGLGDDPNNINRGRFHTVFGGLLKSVTENSSPAGNPIFSVQLVDPREILSNVVLILNNYTDSIFDTKNIMNIYGFLEYNPTDLTKATISGTLNYVSILDKYIDPNTFAPYYFGSDSYNNPALQSAQNYMQTLMSLGLSVTSYTLPPTFPITGTGFSRRSSQGIPYYRVKQAINALTGYYGELPLEYREKAFGGTINFRGFNYVVDFGTLPDLQDLYYFDYDQTTLLDLVQEVCDATSKELFVSLLPIIEHPACLSLYNYNQTKINAREYDKVIAGIIRLDAIDRSIQPSYGAIANYISGLQSSGVYFENKDLGFELSNVTTDKFIVGAQEVDMYYFSTQNDRDNLDGVRAKFGRPPVFPNAEKWTLETSYKQQLLPYYGMLGNNAVTIPKGYGPYQQILLDTTGLNANGVGAYYVATEMELRCASISYDRWVEFLEIYNDTYMESIESNDAEETTALLSAPAPQGNVPPAQPISNNYAVTVPRSVFPSYAKQMFDYDNLPYSPCNPPYGYPLYYKRLTKLGVPTGGLNNIYSRWTSVTTMFAKLKSANSKDFAVIISNELDRLSSIMNTQELTAFEREYFENLRLLLNTAQPQQIENIITIMENDLASRSSNISMIPKLAKKGTQNAMKVYNFLKKIADECLGKKFLVKIPTKPNTFYDTNIVTYDQQTKEYGLGPFGFKPRPVNSGVNYLYSQQFLNIVRSVPFRNTFAPGTDKPIMHSYLDSGSMVDTSSFIGALKSNFNPLLDAYEFNYTPSNLGGYFNFDLYPNVMNPNQIDLVKINRFLALPLAVRQMLVPEDLTNFISSDGRVSPYVRFDHSQHLSFENLNSDDFVQQIITANGFVTDLSEVLDNTRGTEFHRFPTANADDPNEQMPDQVAFVKCSVDEKLYMPPKCIRTGMPVFGQNVIPKLIFSLPRKIYDACQDKYKDSFRFSYYNFVPDVRPGNNVPVTYFNAYWEPTLDSYLINTSLRYLDTNNVYALITLPGKVIPTKDARFRDGPFQAFDAEKFKHSMTMDTIPKEMPGFQLPAPPNQPMSKVIQDLGGCETFGANVLTQAFLTARKAVANSTSLGLPNKINVANPSPVYPDLISLSLMSSERCYGPWISSYIDDGSIRVRGIGGKIEFVKDENLAPWNYGGYDLMHAAGRTQAYFSNSLLLMSERGGFTVPGAPSGIYIGKELLKRGPLVTNITVDFSDNGVRSTYQLDLYTSSFGKLEKQRQALIAQINRERQKIKDEKNAMIRKGLGKGQNMRNYGQDYANLAAGSRITTVGAGQIDSYSLVPDQIVLSVRNNDRLGWSSDPSAGTEQNIVGAHKVTDRTVEGSINSSSSTEKLVGSFLSENDLADSYYNSGGEKISNIWAPISNDPFHANMASRNDPNIRARQALYGENADFSQDEISIYEV